MMSYHAANGEILPEEICGKIFVFLSAKDVESLAAVNRFLRSVGTSTSVLETIFKRDFDKDCAVNTVIAAAPKLFQDAAAAKEAVVINTLKNSLPSVKWYPLRPEMSISAREGHLACTMTCKEQRRIVITGGFTDDERVYIINPGGAFSTGASWSMTSVLPTSSAGFVYGASLTPLPGLTEENGTSVFRAVRYGGFRAGGYSNETNEVALLTIFEKQGQPPFAKWTVIETNDNQSSLGRAYHTATLLMNRYILFVGGMRSHGSILQNSILDTQTWTWLENVAPCTMEPSKRHGHSVVLDSKRNRLVMFGGGSGSDLLRSGRDNTEVWELRFGDNWQERIDNYSTWKWNQIHGENGKGGEDEQNGVSGTYHDSEMINDLSHAETLCLGRCHMSCKIASEMVLLFFGSGHPSTNGLIAYNLGNDKFHRPNVTGHLPCPRFTGAFAACLEEGYILTHGGYSTQLHDSIGQFDIIDLVPSLRTSFNKMPIATERPSHMAITDAQVESRRMNQNHHLDVMQMFFAALSDHDDSD